MHFASCFCIFEALIKATKLHEKENFARFFESGRYMPPVPPSPTSMTGNTQATCLQYVMFVLPKYLSVHFYYSFFFFFLHNFAFCAFEVFFIIYFDCRVICFVIILSGSCCCYRWKKKSTGQIIIGNRTGIEETSAVIVNRHPHPSQYGAFGAAQHPYNWQYQQQYYTGNPPMYQPAGNAPVEKTPSAP